MPFDPLGAGEDHEVGRPHAALRELLGHDQGRAAAGDGGMGGSETGTPRIGKR